MASRSHSLAQYPVADSLRQVAALLNLSPERVLRRAGLPEDHLATETRGVTARQWFSLWEAVATEYGCADMPLRLGQQMARGPFVPAVFAFSCSPDIETGLSRLALFKPLVGPVRIGVERWQDAVAITVGSTDPEAPMPDICGQVEIVFFLESCRLFTGAHIMPLATGAPKVTPGWRVLEPMLGVRPEADSAFRLVLSRADATRPLITRNEAMWEGFEASLRKQLRDRARPVAMAERVHDTLLEALPGGRYSADEICRRLNVSKRTLQRRLKEEGTSFQAVLDDTRKALSLHYLRERAVSVTEISYLLGYADAGSFYRAFHGWTGKTPAEMRRERHS